MDFEFIEHMGGMDIRMFVVSIFNRQTHFHSDIEVGIPLQGDVVITASNKRNLVRCGEFYIINRSEAHSLVRVDDVNMLLVLQFTPNFCRDYYPQLAQLQFSESNVAPTDNPKLYRQLLQNFSDMFKSMGEKKEGYQLSLMGSLNNIASAIVRYAKYENMSREKRNSEEKMRLRLAGIIDYIQKNYTHNISLADLARREDLDMTYLSHFIKNKLGVTFREYVNRLRLERAVDLVTTTNMRMIDVCIDCGYSDYRYLNKAFMQEFKMTPTQVRENGIGMRPAFILHGADNDEADEHKYANLSAAYEWVCRELDNLSASNR